MASRFKHIRILILLLILLFVSLQTWLTQIRSTDWEDPLWVAVYPINGDDSDVTSAYIDRLKVGDFKPIETFMAAQAKEYELDTDEPVTFKLAPEVHEHPPQPPRDGNILDTVFWSLKMRYWSVQNDTFEGPTPDIQMFIVYYDPKTHPTVSHSVGLRKGMVGIVNAFASDKMTSTNNVIIAHELLHTVGATDKYDPATNMPLFPAGFAEPTKKPLYPQGKAELMGGRVPLSSDKAKIPASLSQVVIGKYTAAEIRWFSP